MKIFIYDTEPNATGFKSFLEWLDGMRYMALLDAKYPWGSIICYGRSPERAMAKAKKMIERGWTSQGEQTLVLEDEV